MAIVVAAQPAQRCHATGTGLERHVNGLAAQGCHDDKQLGQNIPWHPRQTCDQAGLSGSCNTSGGAACDVVVRGVEHLDHRGTGKKAKVGTIVHPGVSGGEVGPSDEGVEHLDRR